MALALVVAAAGLSSALESWRCVATEHRMMAPCCPEEASSQTGPQLDARCCERLPDATLETVTPDELQQQASVPSPALAVAPLAPTLPADDPALSLRRTPDTPRPPGQRLHALRSVLRI